jgi:hypothetical protein
MAILSKIEKLVQKYAYSPKTGNLLNHITLSMRDEECRQALVKHRGDQFNRIYWPLFFASWLNFAVAFI